MLPKIRPAMGNGPARPSIRPVQPSALPPRPAPPTRKRVESGLRGKPAPEPYEALSEGVTAVASEPPTRANPRHRADVVALSFEDETQARPVDDHLLAETRDRVTSIDAPIDAPYESFPSLEARHPFDTYEAAFAERDLGSQLAAASHDAARRGHSRSEPPPREIGSGARARPAPSPWDEPAEARRMDHGWHDEASAQQPSWEPPPATTMPRTARLAQDPNPVAHTAFIVGVQPIRQPAYPSPVDPAVHMHAAHAATVLDPQHHPYGQPSSRARAAHAMVQATGPAMHRASQRSSSAPSMQADTPDASKNGRFAWFVLGAAVGVAFAFLAPSFARSTKDREPESLFPAPAAVAAPVAQAANAPPAPTTLAAPLAPAIAAPILAAPVAVTAAPTAPLAAAPAPLAAAPIAAPPAPVAVAVAAPPPIVAAPAPTMTVASPSALPAAPIQQVSLAPLAPAPPAPVLRTAAAPAPQPAASPRRSVTTRRAAPSAESSAPKPLLAGAGTEAPSSGAPDLNDILSGALRP